MTYVHVILVCIYFMNLCDIVIFSDIPNTPAEPEGEVEDENEMLKLYGHIKCEELLPGQYLFESSHFSESDH